MHIQGYRTGPGDLPEGDQHSYASKDCNQRIAITDQGGYEIPALTGTFSCNKSPPPLPVCIVFYYSGTRKKWFFQSTDKCLHDPQLYDNFKIKCCSKTMRTEFRLQFYKRVLSILCSIISKVSSTFRYSNYSINGSNCYCCH